MKIELDEFFDISSIAKAGELMSFVNDPVFFVSDTGITYRNINHWDTMGMITCSRKKEGGDRIFSLADLAWVKLVAELRSFGVPVPVIQSINKEIHSPVPFKDLLDIAAEAPGFFDRYGGEGAEEVKQFIASADYKELDTAELSFQYFHLALSQAISQREPISLIVFKDGSWFPFRFGSENRYPEELMNKIRFTTHVSVSLLDIVFQFISSKKTFEALKDLGLLSKNEEELLDIVQNGSFKKVTVHFAAKKDKPLEIKKGKQAQSQLIEVLRNRQYSFMEVQDEKKKTLHITNDKTFI